MPSNVVILTRHNVVFNSFAALHTQQQGALSNRRLAVPYVPYVHALSPSTPVHHLFPSVRRPENCNYNLDTIPSNDDHGIHNSETLTRRRKSETLRLRSTITVSMAAWLGGGILFIPIGLCSNSNTAQQATLCCWNSCKNASISFTPILRLPYYNAIFSCYVPTTSGSPGILPINAKRDYYRGSPL